MDKLNITSRILDKLGFSEYWDENGTWGGRTLTFSNGQKIRIAEVDEIDDNTQGWMTDGRYEANHWYFAGWFAIPNIPNVHNELYFIHEMWECIKANYPVCLPEFEENLRRLKMYAYIQEYLDDQKDEANRC